MKARPEETAFEQLDPDQYDPEHCETCRKAHAIMTLARDEVKRIQAAGPYACIPVEEMKLRINIVLDPARETGTGADIDLHVDVVDTSGEQPNDDKKAGFAAQVGQITEAVMRLWTMCYMSNDANVRFRKMHDDLAALGCGEENVASPSHLN